MQNTPREPGIARRLVTLTGLLLFTPLCLTGFAHAAMQDQGTEHEQETKKGPPPLPQPGAQGGSDLQKELAELFGKVERNLMEIDIRLSDAGAGDAILEGVPDAGLDDLLRAAQTRGKEAQSQIDRILEIAAQLDQNKSKGSSQSKPGESPPSQSQQQGPKKRENTPEAPKPGEQGEKKEQSEEKKSPGSEDPRKKDQKDRGNVPSEPPADKPGKNAENDPEVDKWGFLPPRQRETFRNQGRDDLPVQYRQWIDTYYRRLNRDQG